MKTTKTSIWTKVLITTGVIFLIAIIGLSFLLHVEHTARLKAEKLNEKSKGVTTAAAELINSFKDKKGSQHATFKPSESIKSNNTAVISKPLLDSIVRMAAKNGINEKQLTDWYSIATTSQARALKAEKTVDSTKRVAYRYRGEYLDLTYNPGIIGDTLDNGTFDYKYNAVLDLTRYTKRRPFLGLPIGKRETFIDIYSRDTLTTINGLRSINIVNSPPSFDWSIPSFAFYSPADRSFLVGQGVAFRYNKISIMGAYTYGLDSKKVRPYVGVAINWLK